MSDPSHNPPGLAPELMVLAPQTGAQAAQSVSALQGLVGLARELTACEVAAVCWRDRGEGQLLPDLCLPSVELGWRADDPAFASALPPHTVQQKGLVALAAQPWQWQAWAPVLDGGQWMGELVVLRREARPLSVAEQTHLLSLADLLAHSWQQQRRLQQLSGHATRLQDLVRAGGDWSWELDAELRHVWIGGDYQAVAGEDPSVLLGQTCGPELLVDAEGQPWPDRSQINDVLARQQAVSRLLSVQRTPRGERYLSRSAVPVTDAQGRFCGFRGITRDLTRTMRSERDARAQRQAVEALQQGRERLEHASRAKNSLLSRVSHELRTPLNAVLGFSQLMAADCAHALAPEQAARLAGIAKAGQRLVVVVDDLLELVNVERQAGADACDEVDLRQAAARAVQAWQPSADLAGKTLLWQDLGPVQALAPPPLVEQILNRLMIDALASGSLAAPVRVVARQDGARAVLDVSHPVLPGAPLDLAQLFEPFHFTGLDERASQGSGLDLVIARDLARACGGDVAARLDSDGALHLQVSLPARAASGSVPQADAALPRQVLYVEDEPLNVVLMQEIFRGRPEWALHIAVDGSEGVALARQLQPDLMLIDINLPDFGGLEVLRQLRADPATQTIPAIALSADAMAEQVAAAREAGFQDYWTKPIDLNNLLQDIATVLG